ncbi:MAG: MFS transporter [Pseudomonadota bacterium]|nr:MFS transporter [Pseudomonadota bacterium]
MPGASDDFTTEPMEQRIIARVSRRLLPLLFLLFIICFIDRTNVGFAALQMNRDLEFGPAVYGLGAGIFFLGYALFEVPSNLILARVGARRWIARIAMTWGVIAAATMFVRSRASFYLMRLLLGVAEAGFSPGIVYYLAHWFPEQQRGRALSRFTIAVPLANGLGGPLGAALLGMDGRLGLAGWQWLFLVEGLPAVVLGLITVRYLTDRPEDAKWLAPRDREWLDADSTGSTATGRAGPTPPCARP